MLKIQPNSRQVPKAKDICSNKKYYDVMYAYFQCLSEKDEDGVRYFDKKEDAIKARKEAENDLYSKYSDVIDSMTNKNNAFTKNEDLD